MIIGRGDTGNFRVRRVIEVASGEVFLKHHVVERRRFTLFRTGLRRR